MARLPIPIFRAIISRFESAGTEIRLDPVHTGVRQNLSTARRFPVVVALLQQSDLLWGCTINKEDSAAGALSQPALGSQVPGNQALGQPGRAKQGGGVGMRKLLPECLALMALGLSGALVSSAAIAGDLEIPSAVPPYKAPAPVVRLFSWEGLYIGGNAGGHWGSDKITTTTDAGWADPFAAPAGDAGSTAIDAASPVTLH